VSLQDVTIKYGDVVAVDNFTAALKPGSTGLLGVNGAGKSSLIKALLGLVPFHSGSAFLLGRDVRSDPRGIRQHVGYMPEDDCLIPGLTGMGLVQYAGELCGMRREDAIQRAHEVLYLVGLEEARYRKVETYSSGMKQRIKLAQALVHDPEFLFLDEPTSGMDPRGRQDMLDLIQTISMQGRISIMLASHILVDVERTCEHLLIMHKGRLVKQAPVADLRGTYSGAYSVRVEGDREAFENSLKKSRCVIKSDGEHLLDITLPQGKRSDLILKAVQDNNVALRRLVPSIQNLEDVFVKLIGENKNADL